MEVCECEWAAVHTQQSVSHLENVITVNVLIVYILFVFPGTSDVVLLLTDVYKYHYGVSWS